MVNLIDNSNNNCSTQENFKNIHNWDNQGNYFTRSGSNIFGSDGSMFTKIGNTIFTSEGTIYQRSGNRIVGSDGSSFTQIGTTIYTSCGDILEEGKFPAVRMFFQD